MFTLIEEKYESKTDSQSLTNTQNMKASKGLLLRQCNTIHIVPRGFPQAQLTMCPPKYPQFAPVKQLEPFSVDQH